MIFDILCELSDINVVGLHWTAPNNDRWIRFTFTFAESENLFKKLVY